MDRRRTATGPRCAGWAVLALLVLSGCVTSSGASGGDSAVTGPEWKVTPRQGVGEATAVAPARLTGIAVEEEDGYDRVLFRYVGSRPGYLVAYDAAAGPGQPSTLRVTLDQMTARDGSRLAPGLPSVREVHQRQGAGVIVESTVGVVAPQDSVAAPFRVGLSTGGFYVDIAHPGVASSR